MTIRVPRLGYGTGDQVRWLTAPGRCKMCRWERDSKHFFLLRAEPNNTGPRRINGIFHRPSFVMGNSFCSVRDNHCCCSVHNGEGSRTSVDQKFDHSLPSHFSELEWFALGIKLWPVLGSPRGGSHRLATRRRRRSGDSAHRTAAAAAVPRLATHRRRWARVPVGVSERARVGVRERASALVRGGAGLAEREGRRPGRERESLKSV
jgi:hypothetical protein